MELWIRSQDRELLVLTKGFELQNPSYNGGCQIFAVWQNNYQCVGNYKSKERALKVLDEIQNALLNEWANNVKYEEHFDDERPRSLVYEMPLE